MDRPAPGANSVERNRESFVKFPYDLNLRLSGAA